jgi:DnaJ-class molecular chaperone
MSIDMTKNHEEHQQKDCVECSGSGAIECDSIHDCPADCDRGRVFDSEQDKWRDCGQCDGPGSLPCSNDGCEGMPASDIYHKDCSNCDGTGLVAA